MIRGAEAAGARLATGLDAARVEVQDGRVQGVRLADGARVACAQVVVASGAWAATHGESCAASLPLVPLRRHLVHLDPARPELASGPVVWATDPEVYFRPEAGGVLSSPCDETASAPCLPDPDDAALEPLLERLAAVAPRLVDASVRTRWACLRTFAPDRELVAGPDPRVDGLHWLAGLGGRGMTIGVAAGELTAQLCLGQPHPLAEVVSPARLLALQVG